MTRRRILGLVIFVAGYVDFDCAVCGGRCGPPTPDRRQSERATATKVTVDVEAIESDNSLLRANLAVSPGPASAGPVNPQSQGRPQRRGHLGGDVRQAHVAEGHRCPKYFRVSADPDRRRRRLALRSLPLRADQRRTLLRRRASTGTSARDIGGPAARLGVDVSRLRHRRCARHRTDWICTGRPAPPRSASSFWVC